MIGTILNGFLPAFVIALGWLAGWAGVLEHADADVLATYVIRFALPFALLEATLKKWLVRFLEHRIGDKRIIRLIQKWLKAGVLEDGILSVDDKGTGQGSVISPLLANNYLHYVLDLWAKR